MKRSATILATIALGAMLATGTATASMARGGGGGGHGGGRGYHASGRHGLDRHGFNRRGFTDPDMYGDYFCESPYPSIGTTELMGFTHIVSDPPQPLRIRAHSTRGPDTNAESLAYACRTVT